MAPKRSQIVVPAQATKPTRQSSRNSRKAVGDMVVDPPKRKASHASGPRQQGDEATEFIIQRGPRQPSKDLYDGPPKEITELPEGDDAGIPSDNEGSYPQSKVSTYKI
jgi:hypothetical protein